VADPKEIISMSAPPRDTRATGYPIDFPGAPPIGTKIVYWRGIEATLVAVFPRIRHRDGQLSAVLCWLLADGRAGLSGLRCSGMSMTGTTLPRLAEAAAAPPPTTNPQEF
jgi:hypothetical protein